MKIMALGHEIDPLARFFSSLTTYDSSALSLALSAAADIANNTPPTASVPTAQPIRANTHDAFHAEGGDHAEYWGMETGTASLRTTFDPVSRRRLAIAANARQAAFFGVHLEEFQERAFEACARAMTSPVRPPRTA